VGWDHPDEESLTRMLNQRHLVTDDHLWHQYRITDLLFMSPEVPTSKPNRPEKIASIKREFSWQSRLNLLISFKYARGVSYALKLSATVS